MLHGTGIFTYMNLHENLTFKPNGGKYCSPMKHLGFDLSNKISGPFFVFQEKHYQLVGGFNQFGTICYSWIEYHCVLPNKNTKAFENKYNSRIQFCILFIYLEPKWLTFWKVQLIKWCWSTHQKMEVSRVLGIHNIYVWFCQTLNTVKADHEG